MFKKIIRKELLSTINELDIDEGILIKPNKERFKIYINKNLMGIYIVLKRTTVKNNKRDKKRAGKSPIQKVNEEFFYFNDSLQLMKFLKSHPLNSNIFLY